MDTLRRIFYAIFNYIFSVFTNKKSSSSQRVHVDRSAIGGANVFPVGGDKNKEKEIVKSFDVEPRNFDAERRVKLVISLIKHLRKKQGNAVPYTQVAEKFFVEYNITDPKVKEAVRSVLTKKVTDGK